MKAKMLTRKQVSLIVYMIILANFLILLVYPFLHELGHLIPAVLFGGKINGMKLGLQAKAFYGGNLNTFQSSIIHVFGFALPFLIWLVFIMSVSKKVHPLVECIKLLFSGTIIGSILPWIIIPILFEFQKAPARDDVTKFIFTTKANGFFISSIFLIILVLSIILMRNKLGDIKRMLK